MPIDFYHTKEILALREGFPKFFSARSEISVRWGDSFAENEFRDAYRSGENENEKFVLQTEILDGTNSIPVTFIEISDELTIEVNGKAIYTMEKKGRITEGFLEAFAQAIKEGIR
jgi:hypothetical protein